jgi:GTP cyclohydrolase I
MKKAGEYNPSRTNNLMEDLAENDKNEHLVADPSRMISMSNELNEVHKRCSNKIYKGSS